MNDEIRLVSEATKTVYKSSVGSEIELIKINNNLMMTAKKMAELYGVKRPAITRHLLKLFVTKQLNKKRVSSILTHKAEDGKLYRTTYYNTQAIIAVGLSLKTPEAEHFQKWLGISVVKKLDTK
jgi:hypothetical protein